MVFPLIKLRLEDGFTARFWYDNWSPFGSLASVLNVSVSRLGIPDKATVEHGDYHLRGDLDEVSWAPMEFLDNNSMLGLLSDEG